VGQSLDIPRVIKDDWKRLDLIINKIKFKLGRNADLEFAGMTLSDLTASRLVATDADKEFESVPGTSTQPEFNGITIKDGSGNVIFHTNHDELYFTECPTDPITGNPIGLLLALTYTI